MNTWLKRWRLIILLGCVPGLIPGLAQAFDLTELSAQLGKPEVVRGPFTQQKFLRALPQPLTSQGQFVLAKAQGLLWQLQRPLRQDYRIDGKGIARRDSSGWQALPGSHAGAEQNRLFFAVLQGDSSALEHDFEPNLSGDSQAWTLQLTPRSALLKQIFQRIEIQGGTYVQRVELFETQGDRTVLTLPSSTGASALSEQERHDFAE